MIKVFTDTRSILLKAVCTVLVLILAGSLFAAGVMGADGCGMKCCQTGTTHMRPSTEKQMRSAMNCCAGDPQRPCDLQTAKPFELPEMILAPSCENLLNADGLSVILSDSDGRRRNFGANFVSQVLNPKFSSPPLYMQNLSLLI